MDTEYMMMCYMDLPKPETRVVRAERVPAGHS